MSLYVMMGCVHPYSPHMMDPLKSSRGLKSSILWTLINGRKDTVSLDRLKPAYLEDAPEPTIFEPSPSTPTHSNDTSPA